MSFPLFFFVVMEQKLTWGVRMNALAQDDEFMKTTWREIADVISKVPGVDLTGYEQ